MFNAYLWLKFVHVTAAILWVGGVVVLAVLARRSARDPGAAGELPIHRHPIGRALIQPAMIVTIVAGLALGHLRGSMPPWATWGLVVAVATVVVVLGFIRRYDRELLALAANGEGNAVREAVLRRRIARLGMLNIVLLLSAVWAMVYKPSF
ncbi:MAG TPA: DUF2269 family protein [Longimicrobiales bacterium]